MYRIYFNPTIGLFVIQVLKFGLFWSTVRKFDANDGGWLKFDTFAQAQEHIREIGLDKLYTDKSANTYRQHMTMMAYDRSFDQSGKLLNPT